MIRIHVQELFVTPRCEVASSSRVWWLLDTWGLLPSQAMSMDCGVEDDLPGRTILECLLYIEMSGYRAVCILRSKRCGSGQGFHLSSMESQH